jgi:hypothetical protein
MNRTIRTTIAPLCTLAFGTAVFAGGEACRIGTLAAKMSYSSASGSPIAVGPMAGRPDIGDMNGDGNPDVVIACGTCCGSPASAASGHVMVLLNDGSGRLTPANGSPHKVGPSARKIALGDLNRDGKLDVAIAEHDTYNVTVLLGDGRGGFAPAEGSPFVAASGQKPHTHEIAMADLNGDQNLDILTTNSNDNSISVLLGNGKGYFQGADGSPFATDRHPYDALAIADFNNDGKADVAVPLLAGNKIVVLFGDGSGGIAHAEDSSRYSVAERPGYLAIGDVNKDGKPDIVATHDDVGMIDVLLNDGAGKFKVVDGSPFRLDTPVWSVTIADLNGDGAQDLALGGVKGRNAFIVLGNGTGQFFPGSPVKIDAGGDAPNYVAVADMNRDGKPDLIAGNYEGGNVSVMLSQ